MELPPADHAETLVLGDDAADTTSAEPDEPTGEHKVRL